MASGDLKDPEFIWPLGITGHAIPIPGALVLESNLDRIRGRAVVGTDVLDRLQSQQEGVNFAWVFQPAAVAVVADFDPRDRVGGNGAQLPTKLRVVREPGRAGQGDLQRRQPGNSGWKPCRDPGLAPLSKRQQAAGQKHQQTERRQEPEWLVGLVLHPIHT